MFTLGSSPNALRHPQNSLVVVSQLAVHLEPDDHLPVRAHDPVSRWRVGLHHPGHAEQHRLAERRRQHLHPDGQAVGARPEGHRDGGVSREVRGDGAHVVHVHRHGVVHLGPEVEGRRRRGGAEQHVDRLVGPVEGPHHQRPHPLGLRVVRVVVAGGQRVGAEHHPALDLGAEARRAGRGVHGCHVLAVDPQPVADAVVAGQVGGGLRRRDEVVGGEAVGELGHRDLLHLRPGVGQGVGGLLHPRRHVGRAAVHQVAAQPDPDPLRPAVHRGQGRLGRRGQRRAVERVVPGQDVEEERGVLHRRRERADLVERAGEGHQPVARDAPVGGLHPDHAAQRGGLADGPARVGAEAERGEARPPPPRPSHRCCHRGPCPVWRGLRVGPKAEFSVELPMANSSMFVLPSAIAPARRRDSTTVAS